MKHEIIKGSEILAASAKVSSEAEVSGIVRSFNSIEMNPLKTVYGSGEVSGWGLRLIRNGKLGVSGEWGETSAYDLVDRAIGSCRYGPDALFSLPDSSPESPSSVPDSLSVLTHEEASAYLTDVTTGVRRSFEDAALTARIQWGEDSFLIVNSRGLRGSYSKTKASTVFSVTLPTPNGLLQSGCTIDTSCSLPAVTDVVDLLKLPLTSRGMNPGEAVGRKRVILSPSAFSVFLQGIRTGVSGRMLVRGASPLEDMKNRKVLNELLTIRDMPILSNGAASAPFDSEGVPAFNKTLFKDGVFTGFIHDLRSASEADSQSTGSSGRNLGEHSRPVCTNLVVDPSPGSSENTLEETGSGILVTDILSAGGGDAASGQFTFDCGRVYLFRRGEIYGYYDGCVITGNIYDALSQVIAIGSKQYRCGSDLLPFISLNSISVR